MTEMKKIYTPYDLIHLEDWQLQCLDWRCFRLLGMFWHKWIRVTENPIDRSITFEYE